MLNNLKRGAPAVILAAALLGSGQAWAFTAPDSFVNQSIDVGSCTAAAIHYDGGGGNGNVFAILYGGDLSMNYGVIPNYDGGTGVPNDAGGTGGININTLTSTDLLTGCGVSNATLTVTGTATGPYSGAALIGFTIEGQDPNNGNALSLWRVETTGVINTTSVATKTVITPPDTTAPMVVLSGAYSTFSSTNSFAVTAIFDEQVTGFNPATEISDLTITGGIVISFTSISSTEYLLTIQPTGNGDVTIKVPNAAAQDLAGNDNTASNTLVIGNRIAEITQEQIAGFMLGRANSLASNQPGLIRFLDGASCGDFNANATSTSGSISGCLSQDNLWVEVTSSWGGGNSYTLGTLGAHASTDPNLIVGGMLQLDHAKDDANNASGAGWMIGPYFATRLAEQSVFFEGRLLYGETSNSITPLGTYTDSFSTERWLAQFKVQGEMIAEPVTWYPSLAVMHTKDSQRAYSDSLDNTIRNQSIDLTQINSGIDFQMPLDVVTGELQLNGGLALIYSTTNGGISNFEGGRGRVNIGLDWNSPNSSSVRFNAFYDGLGSTHESYGGTLGLDIRF